MTAKIYSLARSQNETKRKNRRKGPDEFLPVWSWEEIRERNDLWRKDEGAGGGKKGIVSSEKKLKNRKKKHKNQ